MTIPSPCRRHLCHLHQAAPSMRNDPSTAARPPPHPADRPPPPPRRSAPSTAARPPPPTHRSPTPPPPMAAAATGPELRQTTSIDRIPAEARHILHRLAGELWGADVDPAALVVSQLQGALTNEVFRINWPSGKGDPRKVLVRIYGQGVEVFFDRADEVRTFECISCHGQGPRLLGRFPHACHKWLTLDLFAHYAMPDS